MLLVVNYYLLLKASKEAYTQLLKVWLILIIVITLFYGIVVYPFLEFFISFYPEYEVGLILLLPIIFLSIAKSADIWPIYFTIINKPKYNSILNLILLTALLFIYSHLIINSESIGLEDFGIIILLESLIVLFTPLLFIFYKLVILKSD